MIALEKDTTEESERPPALPADADHAQLDHVYAIVVGRTIPIPATIIGGASPQSAVLLTSSFLAKISVFLRRLDISRGHALRVSIGRHQLRLDDGTSNEEAIAAVEEYLRPRRPAPSLDELILPPT
jgi:hypothetical protein